ncbi:hypothetical protein [Williamsia sp. D3]|uniref:hypothetical protein n=1 Tax=Williamsia sp. D3 TaxID=1313067 RepID=UPI0003D39EE3|nr:hypothetical protein [Williamsia sp. D3]ETD32800.1 hypothetical protein W823_13025 [Williamsia sp. D3]
MSATDPGRLTLRPFYVFASAGFVWVVDERQPVAALFDPDTQAFVRLVSWTTMTPPGTTRPRQAPRFAVDEEGVWIQYSPDEGLGRITPEGLMFATYSRGADLICAAADGAWLCPPVEAQRDISTTPDRPPWREPQSSITHVDRIGAVSTVAVDGIAWLMRAEHDTLYVSVHHEPWTRVPVDYGDMPQPPGGDRYRVVWSDSLLSLPLNEPHPDTLVRPGDLATSAPIDTSYLQDYADESYNEAHLRKRADGDGARWHWGRRAADRDRSVIRAYDTNGADPHLLWTSEIDGRWVMRGTAENHRAWLLTRGSTRSGGHTRLEVWDAHKRTMSTLSEIQDLDISAHRWPTGPRPPDHDSYARWYVSRLDGVEFSDRVSNVRATFVGDWPDGYIELTYRHQKYPGLLISSRINIYDEVGRKDHAFLRYGDLDLREQADTCAYPPASLAVNGVLQA